jgi:hypothetical protein
MTAAVGCGARPPNQLDAAMQSSLRNGQIEFIWQRDAFGDFEARASRRQLYDRALGGEPTSLTEGNPRREKRPFRMVSVDHPSPRFARIGDRR